MCHEDRFLQSWLTCISGVAWVLLSSSTEEFWIWNLRHCAWVERGEFFGWCFIIYLVFWKTCPSLTTLIMDVKWMRCHVERGYGNLTPCGSTLWVRVKRHVIHHWLYSLCTEDTWKVTARSHGRLVENTLLIAEGILYVTILCHNILLVFGLIISDIRMMSLISVDQWLWYMDQFYILFWIRLESGTAYCLNWRYLHWFDIKILYCVFDTEKFILSKWWEHS